MTMEAEPLYSTEIEMALLGSVISDRAAFKRVNGTVRPDSFFSQAHGEIWRGLEALSKQGIEPDKPLLIDWLKGKGKIHDVGGEAYIDQIYEYMPFGAGAVDYAQKIAEKAELRGYMSAAKNLAHKIANGADIDEVRVLAATMPAAARRVSGFVDIADIDASGDDFGITTGIAGIDAAIATGGYPQGQTSIVSAYHKAGKSTFMIQSACHQAELGKRVLYATFADLNGRRVKRRMLRALSGWSRMPEGEDLFGDEVERFEIAQKAIDKFWEFTIFDASKSDSDTVESFVSQLEIEHVERPYDCVFVDYAQKLTSSNRRAQMGGTQEAEWCSHVLSKAAEKLNLAIVVGSQITEGGEKGRTRTKWSAKWEEDAGLVLRIKRESGAKSTINLELSRFGGMGTEIECYWDKHRLIFVEDPR
jgi:replicative DNA helicase